MKIEQYIRIVVTFFLLLSVSLEAQTICDNEIGSHNDFTYEYWKSTGDGCMVLGEGAAFSVTWDNVGNLLARMSKRPGLSHHVVQYAADFKPEGKSFLCVYGWTKNPLVEYYIVENWEERNPAGGTSLGSITTDGGTYNIYRTERVNKPSIEGTKTFYQYWSVRTEKRSKGAVTCANHFDAWASKGLPMGSLYEVSFCLEALRDSKGVCDVYDLSIVTGTGDDSTYVQDTTRVDDPTLEDDIIAVTAPTSVAQNSTIHLSVDYSASTDRDVIVMFQESSSPWGLFVYKTIDVSAGAATLDLALDIPLDVPIATNAYQIQTFITTDGGNWDNRIDAFNRKNISVTKGESSSKLRSTSDQEGKNIKVFPLLCNDGINVNFMHQYNNASLRIFDLSGRMIKQQTLDLKSNNINVKMLKAGGYLLQINYGVDVFMKRIFKQ